MSIRSRIRTAFELGDVRAPRVRSAEIWDTTGIATAVLMTMESAAAWFGSFMCLQHLSSIFQFLTDRLFLTFGEHQLALLGGFHLSPIPPGAHHAEHAV